MRYILNSAVITGPGRYQYKTITPAVARRWLAAGPYTSTVGYQETADALAALLGAEIPVNRQMVKMAPGDQALVFRLTVRLADPSVKGRINDPEWIAEHSEIGLLWLDPGPASFCEAGCENLNQPGICTACMGAGDYFMAEVRELAELAEKLGM